MSIENRVKRFRKEYPEIIISDFQIEVILKAMKRCKVKIYKRFK
jgi:hypothetical protein